MTDRNEIRTVTNGEAWTAWCNLRDYLRQTGHLTDKTQDALIAIGDALNAADKGGLYV